MAPITLKSCPKVYIRETHRSKPPGDTLRFVEGMRDLLGMRDVREATDLDRIGIPVFTCWRRRPDESRTFHTGKGVSAVQAQVSLTLESIERYSSEFREEWADRLIVGSYNALRTRRNTLDPTTLILSQFSDYTPDSDLHWVAGYDICRCEEILVPAREVYHPFHRDEGLLYGSHTNGLASGNTLEEAVFHALTEIIERDAWSIAKYNRENSRTVKGVDAQAMRLLMHYHWPGNVRELENYIERAVVTGNKEILTEDEFPAELALGRAADSLAALRVPMKLEEGNKYLILKTLEKFNGNKTRAAEALGISARTIRNKLAEYGEEVSNS